MKKQSETSIAERVSAARKKAERNHTIQEKFKELFAEYKYQLKDIAALMQIDRGLLWRRLCNPMQFTMEELLTMNKTCRIPFHKIRNCYGAGVRI